MKTEFNIDALEEGEREKDPEVMEWVFETRMEIDEAEVGTELSAIQMQIQNEYDELVQEISDLFAQ